MNGVLPRTSLRDDATPRIRDVAELYRQLYDLWYHRGTFDATLNQAIGLLNCIALWTFAFVAFYMVDWELILTCSGDRCASRSLLHAPTWNNLTPGHALLALCFLLACGVSVLWEVKLTVEKFFAMQELHTMLRPHIRLGDRSPLHTLWYRVRAAFHGRQGHVMVPDGEEGQEMGYGAGEGDGDAVVHVSAPQEGIDDITWSNFIDTVIRRVLRKDTGLSDRHDLDELRVVLTMCNVENYVVALHGHHFFRRGSVLWWSNEALVRRIVTLQFHSGRLLQTSDAVTTVRRQLWLGAVLSLVLYPLVVSFFLAKLLIRHVAVARSNPRYLVEYDWTPEAFWTFQLYNELPHLYQSRVARALQRMQEVMDATEPPSVAFRLPRRVAEIFVLGVVAIGLVNATAVTAGHFGDRAVVWWLWLALVVYGVTSTTQKDREMTHRTDTYHRAVAELFYEDARWRQTTSAFRENMTRHFVWPRLAVLAREFSTVLLLPAVLFLLYWKGENELMQLSAFLHEHSVWLDGIGHTCRLAAFDHVGMSRTATREDPPSSGADEDEGGHVSMVHGDAEGRSAVIHVTRESVGGPRDASRSASAPASAAGPVIEPENAFVGAIDADFVPPTLTEQKRRVSLVHFAAVHPRWAEIAAANARCEDVREVCADVAGTPFDVLPASSHQPHQQQQQHVGGGGPSLLQQSTAPSENGASSPTHRPVDAGLWHVSRMFRHTSGGSAVDAFGGSNADESSPASTRFAPLRASSATVRVPPRRTPYHASDLPTSSAARNPATGEDVRDQEMDEERVLP